MDTDAGKGWPASENANGVPASSPRLASARAYLGTDAIRFNNLNGVVAFAAPCGTTPLGLVSVGNQTQGSPQVRATLG